MPAPGAAWAGQYKLHSASSIQSRGGSDYLPGQVQRVTPMICSGLYSPDWSGNTAGFNTTAYAVYQFNLAGVSGQKTLGLVWEIAPADYGNLWLGFSRWDSNTWQWFAGPSDGSLELGAAGFSPFTKAGTSDMLVAVVLLGTQTASLRLLSIGVNQPPVAQLDFYLSSQNVPADAHFDAIGSSDPDGSIVKYEWQWDGNGDAWDDDTNTVATVVHTYDEAGQYTAWVRVTDNAGATDMYPVEVNIGMNQPPNADVTSDPYYGETPLTVTFNASNSSDTDGSIAKFEWDWDGDGAGPWDYDSGTTAIVTHKFTAPGQHHTWVRVTDDEGGTDTNVQFISTWDPSRPGDWCMFGRNAQHTRCSPFTGPATNVLKWVTNVSSPFGTSSPAIAQDGTLYIGNSDGQLYAFNPDGSIKWQYATGAGIQSSPAIAADGTIFVGSDDWYLYAIYPDGSLKYKYQTGGIVSSPPVIAPDGTVYIGSQDQNVYAMDPVHPSYLWNYHLANVIKGSLALAADGTIYVASCTWSCYAFDPTGSMKWWSNVGTALQASPAVGDDGRIYIGGTNGTFFALDPTDGHKIWQYLGTSATILSSAAVTGSGHIVFGNEDRMLYCLNHDGTIYFGLSMPDGNFTSSPAVDAAGTIYVGCTNNHLCALNADMTTKWTYSCGGSILSSPAIDADGTVYFGCEDGGFYAIGPGGP
jgi:large repetitive protein